MARNGIGLEPDLTLFEIIQIATSHNISDELVGFPSSSGLYWSLLIRNPGAWSAEFSWIKSLVTGKSFLSCYPTFS
ncbi:uncharacterized protein J3R85_017237 [Psidium guajava]|nr:uncharacterized protein J3R85_017237 [Psidium guajava]